MLLFKPYILLFGLLLFMHHPLHLGLTSLELSENEEKVTLLVKVDKESLRYAFLHGYLFDFLPDSAQMDEKSEKVLLDYFSKCFQLKINGMETNLNFSKHQVVDSELWLYFDQKIKFPVDSVLVRNLLLYDVNLNQSNVLIVKTSKFENGYIMNKDNTVVKINLKEK